MPDDQRATTKALALFCAAVIFTLLNNKTTETFKTPRPLLMNTELLHTVDGGDLGLESGFAFSLSVLI